VGDALPGLHDPHPSARRVRASRIEAAELAARWRQAREPQRLLVKRYAGGEPFLLVEADPEVGFRVWAYDLGAHLVRPDGTALASAFPPGPEWLPRRLVGAQVLPLLAVLRGVEVLHAAAVELEGRTVALIATSGVGKSSTAAHLVARGARFVADDGLGIELADGQLGVHPGPRTLNLPEEQLDAIEPDRRARLGRRLGESPVGGRVEVHLEPPTAGRVPALAGIAFLERSGTGVGSLLPATDAARRVLANCHVSYLSSPRRRVAQLDVAAALAASVEMVGVRIGAGEDGPAVAARIEQWARGL
jgi:hypothetical protein